VQPTAGVIDSQSVKTPGAKKRGYDEGKKIVGRKVRDIVLLCSAAFAVLSLAGAVYEAFNQRLCAAR
jgi:hypothetical protein